MGIQQIKAGEAYVAIYGDNSDLVESLRMLRPAVEREGEALAKIGDAVTSTFSKGKSQIESTTEKAKGAQVALVAMATASHAVSDAAQGAMVATAASSQKTADGVQSIVQRMNQVAPAAKGFASAFTQLRSADVTLANGAFGVSSLITLLKGGGPAAKPLLDVFTGIVGKGKEMQAIATKVAAPAMAAPVVKSGMNMSALANTSNSAAAASGSNPPAPSDTGLHSVQGIADKLQQTYARIYGLIKSRSINPSVSLGKTKLYDQAAIDALATAIKDIDGKKGSSGAASGPAVWMNGIYNKILQASRGNTANMMGVQSMFEVIGPVAKVAYDAVSKTDRAMYAIGVTGGAVAGAADGTWKTMINGAKLTSVAFVNILGGLVGIKGAFSPVIGQMTAMQKVANKAQWASLFVGSKKQRSIAKQMGVEADAAAIGEAFARGWVPGFAKYARLGVPRAIASTIRGVSSLPRLAVGAIGGMLTGRGSPDALGQQSTKAAGRVGVLEKSIDRVATVAKRGRSTLTALSATMGAIGGAAFGLAASIGGRLSGGGESTRGRLTSIGQSSTDQRRSVSSTSELEFGASASGSSLKNLDSGMDHFKKLVDKANDGSVSATESLNKMGLSADRLSKMGTDEAMKRLGQSLNSIHDPAERDRQAIAALGDSGAELVPLLTNLDSYRSRARQSGSVVSAQDVEAAKKMSLAMSQLKATLTAAWNRIATASVKGTLVWIEGATKFIEKNQTIVTGLVKVLAGLGAIAGGMMLWANFGGPVVSILKSAGILIAALSSPIGLVVAGIAGAVAAWMYFTDSGRSAFQYISGGVKQVYDMFMSVWSGIVAAVGKGDFALAANIAWTGMKLGFVQALQSMGVSFSALMQNIYGGTNVVTDVLSNGWAFVSTAFRAAQNGIAKGMIALTGGISKLWAQVFSGIVKGFNNTHNLVGKGLLYLYGKSTGRSDEDMRSDMEGMDQQTNHFNAQAEQQRQSAIGPEMVAQMAELDAMAQSDMQKIEATRKQAIADHQAKLQAQLAALMPDDERITGLQAELNALIKKAKDEEADPSKQPGDVTAPEFGSAGKAGKQAGTFSAAAAVGLGGGGVFDQIVEHTKDTASILKQMEKRKQQYPAFGGKGKK